MKFCFFKLTHATLEFDGILRMIPLSPWDWDSKDLFLKKLVSDSFPYLQTYKAFGISEVILSPPPKHLAPKSFGDLINILNELRGYYNESWGYFMAASKVPDQNSVGIK